MNFLNIFNNKSKKIVKYYDNGNIKNITYKKDGEYHRDDGPAYQEWYKNGIKKKEIYYIKGKHHRENGPAYQGWFENGKKQIMIYYKNNKMHREDGPAYQSLLINGNKDEDIYYINDMKHKEDGPAIIFWNKYDNMYIKYYCLNDDTYYIIEEWLNELKKINSPHYEKQKELYKLIQSIEKYNL